MIRNFVLSRFSALGLALALAGGVAHAQQDGQRVSVSAYEAEEVTTFTATGRPSHSRTTKVFQGADGSRREESPEGIRITNTTTRTVVMLSSGSRQALVTPMPTGRRAPLPKPAAMNPVSDLVDGRPTLKYDRISDPKRRSRMWVDAESGAVVFSEFTSETATVTKVLRKLKVGPVPQSLFEVPEGYEQVPTELPEAPPTPPPVKIVRPQP